MALPVQKSRFAVLPDDFLDDKVKPIRKPKKHVDTSFAFLNESNKKTNNKAKKPVSEADKLRQDAFAAGGKKKNKKKNKNSNSCSDDKSQHEMSPAPAATAVAASLPNSQQFQEWKESDTKVVDDAFVKDIEKALMLSMIEAEQGKAVAKEKEEARVATAAASRKTMSLDEFNRLMDPDGGAPPPVASAASQQPKALAPSTIKEMEKAEQQQREFFSEVELGAKKIVNRERIRESIHKMHLDMAAQKEKETHEQLVADSLASAEDVARLTAENEGLRSELAKVKSRYKTMRGLLEDAEVKSKAELAAEVYKLRNVKDEVVGEVGRLTQELEQSKTRVVCLENTVKLLQEKRFSNKSESK